jgi:hypothetical protein
LDKHGLEVMVAEVPSLEGIEKNTVDIMFSEKALVLSCNTSVFICLKALLETRIVFTVEGRWLNTPIPLVINNLEKCLSTFVLLLLVFLAVYGA